VTLQSRVPGSPIAFSFLAPQFRDDIIRTLPSAATRPPASAVSKLPAPRSSH
jgi:hypothetical protein